MLKEKLQEEKTKPVWKDRMGAVGVAVWQNQGENGTFYNVTFGRLYKKEDQWHESESFGREDLSLVAKLASRAQDWIYDNSKDKKE